MVEGGRELTMDFAAVVNHHQRRAQPSPHGRWLALPGLCSSTHIHCVVPTHLQARLGALAHGLLAGGLALAASRHFGVRGCVGW